MTEQAEQWTGTPMLESCGTTEFFEPDTLYVDDSNTHRPAEFTPEFWCKALIKHPDVNRLFAVGLYRNGHFQRWHLQPVIWTFTDWQRATWTKVDG